MRKSVNQLELGEVLCMDFAKYITTSRWLHPISSHITSFNKNEYTVIESFQFAEEICEQDPKLSMGSLRRRITFY